MPSIVIALGTMIAGCALILLAANLAVFPLVLVGLFVLASGITILQVAANPLVAALGDPDYSHFRLTFSQTFNSLGTFIAPILGAHLFLKGVEVKEGTSDHAGSPRSCARWHRHGLLLAVRSHRAAGALHVPVAPDGHRGASARASQHLVS